jgi:CcmD family protein
MFTAALMIVAGGVAMADETTPGDTMEASSMAKYKENLPASRFVLIAYGVVWTGLFIYMLTMHKRQGALEERIIELEEALKAHDAAVAGS